MIRIARVLRPGIIRMQGQRSRDYGTSSDEYLPARLPSPRPGTVGRETVAADENKQV